MMQPWMDFFNSDDFMPHGHCFLWQSDIFWLHLLSDAGIVAAYFSIPFALVYFVWKRKDLPFQAVFLLFGAFILLCGTTHALNIWVLWHPDYAIEGVVKAMTAIVSIATFFVTIKLIPQALQLASPAQLARQVEQRTAELQRSLQALDEFAHIVSHDLKEPVRGLNNQTSFLITDFGDVLGEDGKQRLQRLAQLAQKMEGLISDMLHYSRLGHAELTIQEADPNVIIGEIEQMMELLLKERHASIVIPRPLPSVTGDKSAITEVFRNLITNAVKYNDKEKKIIEIGCQSDPEGQIFYVKDNGIGIAPEFHEEIFRIFKRLNEEKEEDDKKGTGVGLTFVRKIVERHGGRIWLESKPGQGTIFYFTITQGQGTTYEAVS